MALSPVTRSIWTNPPPFRLAAMSPGNSLLDTIEGFLVATTERLRRVSTGFMCVLVVSKSGSCGVKQEAWAPPMPLTSFQVSR